MERDALLGGHYVPRKGLNTARESLRHDLIKVITGPRRAGKSVFAVQMLKDVNFAYLNFDDERLVDISDYDELLKSLAEVYGETEFILFDEIQNLPAWELFVNRLHRRGINLVITGSNSRLLSKELATHLTGRFIEFQVFPFSFVEFLRARNFAIDITLELKERQGLVLNYLNEYITTGGFPEVVTKDIDSRSYLTTLFEGILFKDIVKRYNVRQTKKIYDLGLYLITNHSSLYSFTRLKNLLGFRSVHTVENYTAYLEAAFLLFSVERFSHKAGLQLKSPRKIYAFDTGTINAVKFKIAPDTGRILENLVAVELLRRKNDFFYYKTKDGKEVDFAIKKGLRIEQLIQVCYDSKDYATKKRETRALVKVAQEIDCNDLIILSWDEEGFDKIKDKDIRFLPLWKWLTAS